MVNILLSTAFPTLDCSGICRRGLQWLGHSSSGSCTIHFCHRCFQIAQFVARAHRPGQVGSTLYLTPERAGEGAEPSFLYLHLMLLAQNEVQTMAQLPVFGLLHCWLQKDEGADEVAMSFAELQDMVLPCSAE